MFQTISVSTQNNFTVITLSRPQTYNAMNAVMAKELQEAIRLHDLDEDVRAILLTGEGKAFCSGQDLADIEDLNDVPFQKIIQEQYNPLVKYIAQMKTPIVAHVNGVAAGAGANLALLCDIILASDTASFIQAFSKIGLVPDTGGTWYLPRIVGYQNALAMMLTGDKISAEEALRLGMIYRTYPSETAKEQVMEFMSHIASMPTLALVHTKKLLLESYGQGLEAQINSEMNTQEMLGKTSDFSEGVQAFLEKRNPNFQGK